MEALYLQYRGLLLCVAGRKFHVPDADCEPLVQEALFSFLTAGCHIHNPKAWLVGAVCNASRRYWRDRARTSEMEGTRLDELADAAQQMDVERLEQTILVRRLLERLRPGEREILRLHYFEGQTAAEIAATLDTTVRYAEKLICKALAQARREYVSLHRGTKAPVSSRSTASPSPGADGSTEPEQLTRVQRFMRAHGISDVELAAESGVGHPHLNRILSGAQAGPGRRSRVLGAIRRITGCDVQMDELFDARSDVDAA